MKFIDETGKRFGRLTVLKRAAIKICNHVAWECLCDCGNTIVCRANSLETGNTKSCGCYNDDQRKKSNYKHGESKAKEYFSWNAMMQRCYNPKSVGFKSYGAVGCFVMPEWHDYKIFLKDMGRAPSSIHTVDRIDNTKLIYGPGFCRWATPTEQANNKSNHVTVVIDGVTKNLKQWSVHFGIPYGSVTARRHNGHPLNRELFRKPHSIKKLTTIAKHAEEVFGEKDYEDSSRRDLHENLEKTEENGQGELTGV